MLAALLLATSLLPGSAATSSDTLTVAACVELARQRAPGLLVAERRQRAAAEDSAAVSFNRRPDFSLRSGATVAPRGFYDPVVTNLGDYELKVAMDWTLADGGARARARRRGGLELSAARLRSAQEARDAGLQAASFAVRLIRLSRADSAQRQSLAWLASLASLVRSGVASGVRGPADSIRVALERDALEADLETTRLETRSTTLELRGLLGEGGDGPLTITAADDSRPRPEASDSARLVTALARQPELALARIAEQQSRLDLEDARRQSALSFELSLDAGLAGADLTRPVPEALRLENPDASFADRVRQDLGASLAVRARLPLLDSALPHRVQARTAEGDAARLEGRAAAASAERQTLVLLAQWRSTSRTLDAVTLTLERAERNLLKVKSLYGAGAASLLDLLDARRVFEDARDRQAEVEAAMQWARFQVQDRR